MNAYKNIKYFFDGYWKILITLYNLAMFKFSLMVKVQTVRFGWCFAVRLHAMQDNDYIWLYWWCDNFNTVNLGSIVCLLCITAQYVDLGCLGSFSVHCKQTDPTVSIIQVSMHLSNNWWDSFAFCYLYVYTKPRRYFIQATSFFFLIVSSGRGYITDCMLCLQARKRCLPSFQDTAAEVQDKYRSRPCIWGGSYFIKYSVSLLNSCKTCTKTSYSFKD